MKCRTILIILIILVVTTACTRIQPQNQAKPAPLGYIEIPTKDEILANAQSGVEQPEIIYARLLLRQEATESSMGGIYKPDDPVWVVAVKSGNKRIHFPGFGDIEMAGILRISKAATGEEIIISSIQDIENDAVLQRLEQLPDRYGTIEIQPEPIPTAFTPPPTPTAMPIAPNTLESHSQDATVSPLPAPAIVSPLPAPDILKEAISKHAGANPIDCGVVPIDGATEAANQCVDDAYQAKQAFTVVYNIQGMDSFVADGLAGNREGEIRAYHYDSDPDGGGGPVGNPSEVVHERECPTIIPIFWGTIEMRGCE